jgi:hypothetical protein
VIRDFVNLIPVKVITLSVFHSKNVIIPLILLCFFSRPPFPQNSWTLLIFYFKSKNNEVWREAERGRSWWEAPVFRFSNFNFQIFLDLKSESIHPSAEHLCWVIVNIISSHFGFNYFFSGQIPRDRSIDRIMWLQKTFDVPSSLRRGYPPKFW